VLKRFVLPALLFLFAGAIFLGGCIDGQMSVSFNLDGSADVEFKLLADPFVASMAGDGFQELQQGLEEDGFTLEDHEEEGKQGFIANLHVDDAQDLSEMTFLGEIDPPELEVEESLLFTTYTFEHTFQMDDMDIGGDAVGGFNMDTLGPDVADMQFVLEFPISPLEHNADAVSEDGRTLFWNMALGEPNEVAVAVNVPNIPALVILFVIVIGVIVGAIITIKRVRGNKQNNTQKKTTS